MSTKNAAASISTTIGNVTLELRQGNIALLDVDAVVNAANEYLNLGAGVAGAIREAGGEIIQKECHEIGFCPVGSAVIPHRKSISVNSTPRSRHVARMRGNTFLISTSRSGIKSRNVEERNTRNSAFCIAVRG